MRTVRLPLALLAASLSLGACSTLPGTDSGRALPPGPVERPQMATQEDLAELSRPRPGRPDEFSQETLLALLTAEIAGQRNQADLSLAHYVQQARETRDLGIIIRALRISQYLKAEQELLEMAALWSELDPTAAEPHQLASLALIRARDYKGALTHMERLLDLEGSNNFDNLALHAKNLAPEDRAELLGLYEAVLRRHPDNPDVMLGHAMLQQLNDQGQAALATLDRLLRDHPEHQRAILMRAQILHESQGIDAALDYLRPMARRHPENRQLGALYARLLVDSHDMAAAQREFGALVERFPDVPGLRLSHALVALENQEFDLARAELQELLRMGQHANEAHFYLARIAEQQQRRDEAIQHYQQVTQGTHYFTSLGRSAFLLAQSGRLEQALHQLERARIRHPDQAPRILQLTISLLLELQELDTALTTINDALAKQPDDPQLLYTRATIHDKRNDISAMEQDLRQILAQEPDNAIALNALGYTLADRTDRYQEAFELIRKALELKPDNPAIMDSMGWVNFRLGNLEEAVKWLRAAYQSFPDPEIAAHLGEALWVMGQPDEAMKVWLESLAANPDNSLVTDTMRRLGAPSNADSTP